MEILDCRNKDVRISKCSITVKDSEGKTCGVVKNISHFYDIQTNKQVGYFHLMKKAGIWSNHLLDIKKQVVIDSSGKLYLFRNMNGIASLRKFTPELVEKLDNIYTEARENGVEVIEVLSM